MNLPDLEIRIQQLFDDELTDEQFAELETELLENPEAMELYLSYAGLDSDLKHHASYQKKAEQLPVIPVTELLARQRRRSIRISMLSAAAVLAIIAVIMWLQHVPEKPDTLVNVRATPGSEFSLTHNTDEKQPTGNAMVENSRLVLRHGVVELQLPHDVRAIVEAPADVLLHDVRTLELDHGRAFFEVSSPDGHGFAVVTPHQRIVDLGTSFGIDCQKGKAEVELHVVDGNIRVDSHDGRKGEIISAARSVLLSGTKITQEGINYPTTFLKSLPPKIKTLLDEDFSSGLATDQNYVIEMDSTVIRDHAGNRFKGIGDDVAWKFRTAPPLGTVRNFSFEDNAADGGEPVEHWAEVTGLGSNFNTIRTAPPLKPTHGKRHLIIIGKGEQSPVLTQDLGIPIKAGSTYRLTVDVGANYNAPADGFIRLFGSDIGYKSALAEAKIQPTPKQWFLDKTLTYTATEADATGQTLGIALGSRLRTLVFDNVRITPICDHKTQWQNNEPAPPLTNQHTGIDKTPPLIEKLTPADTTADASPTDHLTITFNEPVQLGTGRIFIKYSGKNPDNTTDSELIVGDSRISVDGNRLTITPPLNLLDGTEQMETIYGWDSRGWVGIFNPSGNDKRYSHSELDDQQPSLGAMGDMRGPVMATLSTLAGGAEIRRNIGKIAANHHYSVTVSIGVRQDSSSFPGYTIRLVSGDSTLAKIASNTPPGPPNSVNAVGFSWDASQLPNGVQPGDPLKIVISTNQTSDDARHLDLGGIRISSIGPPKIK
ncbi:MAG: Ig-like domain-containing protein [Verrucomicrobiae bacterium]|nr:Ig-like domain-containing protein [Verrucomicrobiae bacterium]NNJ87410.1 hypothetical protein [Akkermansiaceae bacterium]